MAEYREPSTRVEQQFESVTQPVVVGKLPPAIMGSAYKVRNLLAVGDMNGLCVLDEEDNEVVQFQFGNEKVLYDKTVAGEFNYNRFPLKVQAVTSFGNLDVEPLLKNENGIFIEKDTSVDIPGTSKSGASCKAKIPCYIYKSASSPMNSTIDTLTKNIVSVPSGGLIAAGICKGQTVYLKESSNYLNVGTIHSFTDKSITLEQAYSAAVDGSAIFIGSEIVIADNFTETFISPNTVYDPNGKFLQQKVKPGDLISLSLPAIPESMTTPLVASIVFVLNEKTLFFNNNVAPTQEITRHLKIDLDAVMTLGVNSYKISRLLGFSKDLKINDKYYIKGIDPAVQGLKASVADKDSYITYIQVNINPDTELDVVGEVIDTGTGEKKEFEGELDHYPIDEDTLSITDGVEIFTVSAPGVLTGDKEGTGTIIAETGVYTLAFKTDPLLHADITADYTYLVEIPENYFVITNFVVGDYIGFSTARATATDLLNYYKIISITRAADAENGDAIYALALETPIVEDDAETLFLFGYRVVKKTPVVMSYRCFNDSYTNVVKDINNKKDITTYFTENEPIDIFNDLAYMCYCAFTGSGGSQLFAINIDPTLSNQADAYSGALEKLKQKDCYTHVPGTVDPTVNTIFGTYVDEESLPENEHEKVAILTYLEKDLSYIGSSSGTYDLVSGRTTFEDDLDVMEVEVGDIVECEVEGVSYSGSITERINANVFVLSITGLEDGQVTVYGIYAGTNLKKSLQIKNKSLLNKRLKVIFPGTFVATYNKVDYEMPSYFIAALRAGLDNKNLVRKSMTRVPISLPEIINYRFNTNHGDNAWNRDQLNNVASGGFDIQTQIADVTNNFRSRHDLTTDMTDVKTREWSIVKQADVCSKTFRAAVEPYISQYSIDPQGNFFKFLSTIISAASSALSPKVINKAKLVSLKQDEYVEDKTNVVIEVVIYIPDNYIDITLIFKSK